MYSVKCIERTWIAFLLLFVSTPTATQNTVLTAGSSQPAMSSKVVTVPAVVGGEADLPCDSRPPIRNDSLLLVVWYRDDNPVYSFDTRATDDSGHWVEDAFKNRARWNSLPSALRIHNVQAKDRAVYRCRVDYQISPTRNFIISLDVVELPNKPVIFDEFGKQISGIAGPYNEGGDFRLNCTVNRGNPTPKIQWLQGDIVLETLDPGVVQAGQVRTLDLVVKNVTRAHLLTVYTCTADNTLLSKPQTTSVKVDVYLRPLTVEILSREHPLSVGRMTELSCKSTGARPPAKVTWWLGGRQLNSVTKQTESEDGNETQSLLRWTPLKEHNGQVLICRAEHPMFNYSAIESKLPLSIYYVPVATIHLGAKMNPNDIEEGDDVYFGCEVDANPPAYKVVWEHDGTLLQHNAASGVITHNTNLALRNVSRHQAGKYTCTASNVEGDGKSPVLRMQVVYKPLCRKRDIKMIGAALQEPSSVVCEVDAYPAPATFEWTLNNSAGFIKVDPERFTVETKEGKSVLTFTPVSDVDYGTLFCRASNLAGQQVSPCVYTILPATRPEAPYNCTVYNLTDDSLDLVCVAGYEGGLQCMYLVEVWANEGLVVNTTNSIALWNLRRLGAKRHLRLIVYAVNARGRSEHVTLTVETAPRLPPRTEAQEAWEVNWALGGVLGAAITVAIVLCLALVATKLRQRARDYEVTIPSSKTHKATLMRGSPIGDERNPDLIPLSKGVNCPPDPPQYSAVVASPEPKHSGSAHSMVRTSPTTPISQHAAYADSQSESGRSGINGAVRSHREVVTTRTPLLAAHQESCV
ncbi:hemicentin-2-like isoform X1 [Cydia pomonella]|uniref:hemicentin-2-like isoform X1 n=1 Tax=Cydia pomonella TaxID=82600 RepID=UPI002ADDCFB0|nr:hemicentin-2-like isoform X1 [Cydia pomonella]XP_061706268.1 hemicentin-2-like isoform X1 [Cydia pomonella]